MFILYAIPTGIVAGFLLGGRLEGVAAIRFRWVPVILIGLLVQVAIFTDTIGRLVGGAGPALYVASTSAVFVAVLRNVSIPGVWLIAAGAGCNLGAIATNGGLMPADPQALVAVGAFGVAYPNSVVLEHPTLAPLTDLFALPTWLPFANVFSIGDVLIGVGVAATIALAMRSVRSAVRPGRAS